MIIQLYTDGGSRGNPGPSAAGVHVLGAEREMMQGVFLGTKTNNQAEYLALELGISLIAEEFNPAGIEKLEVYMDSELIVKQMKGEYKIKDPLLKKVYERVWSLLGGVAVVEFTHIPRAKNAIADKILNKVLDFQDLRSEA